MTDPQSAEAAIVKRTLAAAYRQQAGWTDDSRAIQALLDLASQVEAFDPGDACCPCCEEVTCDDGCPLEPVRRQFHDDAGVGISMIPAEFEAFTRAHGVRWEQP